jgi:hypothetical protein
MLLYTAGAYSANAGVGTVDENIAVARDVAVTLWDMGYTVICPHLNTAHFDDEIDLPNEVYVDRDLLIVERCDGIVMMPKWQQSRGAVRELEHALKHELEVFYWPDVPYMPAKAQKSIAV